MSELHVVKQNTTKRDQIWKIRFQTIKAKVSANSVTAGGSTPSYPKKDSPPKDTVCYKCGKKGHFMSSCRCKNGKRTRESQSLQKSMN